MLRNLSQFSNILTNWSQRRVLICKDDILIYSCQCFIGSLYSYYWPYENKIFAYFCRIYFFYYVEGLVQYCWWQHPTRHQLNGHFPPITKTIQVRRTRHTGHCWRSKDELISDVLPWTPAHGQGKAGRPAWTYIQQLCEDTGCNPEDLPKAMNDR